VATNASWGIDAANPANYPIWCGFYNTLGQQGIINCGATTNANLNVDVSGDMPTGCTSPYMVGVGRSDRNDNFAGGYGLTTIDFVAPGISVRTTSNTNNYTTTTGTSFASPLTAGVVALLYAIPCPNFMNNVIQSPQGGANFVLNALMNGVDQKPQLADSFITGGRLNAKRSMDLLMTQTCTLSSENNDFVEFGAYPNPSNGLLNIKVNSNEKWQLKIYNTVGQVVYQFNSYENLQQIDLNHLNNGLYLMQCQFESGVIKNEKLLIKR
jgi:hypothetical protein